MAIIGKPTEFYDKARGIFEIDGIVYAGFKTFSEIDEQLANISHREGGGQDAMNHPGNVTRAEITIERAFSNTTEMWDWYKGIRDGTIPAAEVKRIGRFIQRDEAKLDKEVLEIGPCYIRKCGYGGWDKDADEAVYENIIIVWDGPLERYPA